MVSKRGVSQPSAAITLSFLRLSAEQGSDNIFRKRNAHSALSADNNIIFCHWMGCTGGVEYIKKSMGNTTISELLCTAGETGPVKDHHYITWYYMILHVLTECLVINWAGKRGRKSLKAFRPWQHNQAAASKYGSIYCQSSPDLKGQLWSFST